MEKVLLKKIAKQVRGVTYKPEDIGKERTDEFIPVLRAGNIGTSTISNLDDMIFVSEKKVSQQQYLQAGDILIATSSGSIQIVGKSIYIDESLGFSFGAFCKVVRPNKKLVNPKYVSFFFQTDFYRKKISALAQGANINNLRNEHIDNLEIPLPDLEIQNKIVAILDKAKAILDKREKTIAKYDELLRATFLEMFGNPMERPNRWEINPINDCIKKITAGSSYGGEDKKELQDDELGVLKISAVTKGIFNPTEYKAVKKDRIKKKVVHPRKGDLLFSRANTLELVGATSIVDNDYEELFLPDKLWKIDTDETLIKKVYLHYVLQDKDVRKSFLSIATGSSGSMLNISMDRFRNIIIPYPPIELQYDFEIKHSRIQNLLIKLRSYRNTSEHLMKSLSHQVFSERIIIDVDAELEALINSIDLDKNDEENMISSIVNDITFIQRLIDRLGEQEFEDKSQYDRAKYILFRVMKEEENLVKQIFKDNKIQLTLQNETT